MELKKPILLVVLLLLLAIMTSFFQHLIGSWPEFEGYAAFLSWVGRVAWGFFLIAFVWLIWLGYDQWRESSEEVDESERLFFEAMEDEMQARLGNGTEDRSDRSDGSDKSDKSDESDGSDKSDKFDGSDKSDQSDSPPPSHPLHSVQSPQSGASFPLPPSAAAGVGGAPAISPAAKKLAAELTRVGVLSSYEGKVDLPPPAPPAPIYRLRTGGLALLLDELETHRFLAFQTKRFRAVIVRGPEGEPLVVRRYQDFIADELDSATDKGR